MLAGARAPPCVTCWRAHKRTMPLKAGPASFKRLLGGGSFYRCSRIGVPGHVLGTIRAVAIPARASAACIRSMPE